MNPVVRREVAVTTRQRRWNVAEVPFPCRHMLSRFQRQAGPITSE
jgi:hypothetical protein